MWPSHQLSAHTRVILVPTSCFGSQSTGKITDSFQDIQHSSFKAKVEFQASASAIGLKFPDSSPSVPSKFQEAISPKDFIIKYLWLYSEDSF